MDPRRAVTLILVSSLTWAVLWPVTALSILGVLVVVLGPNGDVGPLDVVAIVAPLGAAAGAVFGAFVAIGAVLGRRPIEDTTTRTILLVGLASTAIVGIVGGLTASAIMNALVLGAIAALASPAIARTWSQRLQTT